MTISPPAPLLTDDGISRLREALTAGNYTPSALEDMLGPVAWRLPLKELRAFVEAIDSEAPLLTLYRLFRLAQTTSVAAAKAALNPLPLDDAVEAGLVEYVDGGVHAQVALTPRDDSWLVTDLPFALRQGTASTFDHVLEFGQSASLMARLTIRRPVETALDLGTGSGVQAVHLSKHAKKVTCTDISPRALRFAATTAALNGLEWELLQGDLAEPVSGRQFDLVVFNAPFVVSPGERQYLFSDSGREGDGFAAELIATAPKLLTPGGHMQFLGHWLHVAGEDWEDRVGGWIAGTGLDALVVSTMKVLDPVAYVVQWITMDPPERLPARAAAWLDWFRANNVEAIGGGVVVLRGGGAADPTVRCVKARLPGGQLGDDFLAWFAGCDLSRSLRGPALWDTRLRVGDGVTLFQQATPTGTGWTSDTPLLANPSGMQWKVPIEPAIAATVDKCDGSRPLREIVDELAQANDLDPTRLAESMEARLHLLIERGMLVPAA
jgi:hypothetical protein